jgi:hypothetical protein
MTNDNAQSSNPAVRPWYDPARLAVMFIAAFLATLIFHQGMFAVLHGIGMVPAAPYKMAPSWPFGVPSVISLALWGGLWGFVFSWAETKFPRGAGYWIAALLFGAIFPTLVAWFVVFPLKGLPAAAGFVPARMLVGLLVNGAWGLGTAILYRIATGILGWNSSASRA